MLTSRLTLAALALALTLSVGCSRDRHEINSTYHLPATLTLIDTVTDQTVWSMDIPAGQRLVYDFDYDSSHNEALKSPNVPASSMRWWTYPAHAQANYGNYNTTQALDSDVVELPGRPILQRITYREATTPTQPASLVSPEDAAKLPPIRLELEVREGGAIVFDGSERDDAEIGNLFRSLYGERRIIITGKPGTPRANLVALQDKIQRPDLVTVVIPPAEGEADDAMDEEADAAEEDQVTSQAEDAAMEEDAEAEAEDAEGDAMDAIDDAMEGK